MGNNLLIQLERVWLEKYNLFLSYPRPTKPSKCKFSLLEIMWQSKANHYHLFWSFPKVNSFWQDIHKCLEKIVSAQLPFDFLHMYLGQEPLNITTPADKCLLRIITMSAKKTLTRHWLQPNVPGIQELYNTVYQIFVMERLTMSLRLQRDRLEAPVAQAVAQVIY